METAPTLSAQDMVSANLRMVLRGLSAALGAWLEPTLAVLMHRQASRTISKIERMLARFRTGRLWRVTQRRAVPGRRAPGKPAARLPRRFGWLVLAGKHHAACFGTQLQTVLATPDMAELLAASAQAKRVLRPLCRALAVELPWVIDRTEKTRPETKPRIRKPRVKPEPFRIPLPRGVLTAARRQGFGKMR